MAWLRLTKYTGYEVLVNIDQASEFSEHNDGSTVWCQGSSTSFFESVDEIAAMIAAAERQERLDGIFKAIVPNFPHGYDPAEIVETARRLLDALDKPREA